MGRLGRNKTWAHILTPLILLAHCLCGDPAAANGGNPHGIAVIIGNQAYGDEFPSLPHAHNDAAAMADFVREDLGFSPGNVIEIRDAKLEDLIGVFGDGNTQKGQLSKALVPGKSDVIIYYAGHGAPGLRDRRPYLLPSDGDANLAEFTAYPLGLFYANLRQLPARHVMIVIEAGFSGETPLGMLVARPAGQNVSSRSQYTTNITLLTAAQGGQVAHWDDEAQQGLFTKHFLTGAKGAADSNQDGKVNLAEMRAYLARILTPEVRTRHGREQTPTISGRDGDGIAPQFGAPEGD